MACRFLLHRMCRKKNPIRPPHRTGMHVAKYTRSVVLGRTSRRRCAVVDVIYHRGRTRLGRIGFFRHVSVIDTDITCTQRRGLTDAMRD
jgi:hypothetical protein